MQPILNVVKQHLEKKIARSTDSLFSGEVHLLFFLKRDDDSENTDAPIVNLTTHEGHGQLFHIAFYR